jgi:hypothetical protein
MAKGQTQSREEDISDSCVLKEIPILNLAMDQLFDLSLGIPGKDLEETKEDKINICDCI